MKNFQIIKCEVSLIKNVKKKNVNGAARMNTKQQQQQYSKWMCLQLSRAEFNGLNTTRELKSELAELKTKGKYM